MGSFFFAHGFPAPHWAVRGETVFYPDARFSHRFKGKY